MLAVCMITAALVFVLSVFNGLEDLLRSLNNSFDPEIKIQATKGKSFPLDEKMLSEIKSIEGVAYATELAFSFEGKGMMAQMMNKMGGMTMTSEVTDVSAAPIADSVFEVPAGYKTKTQ